MTPRSRREVVLAMLGRYRQSTRAGKTTLLEQLCAATGYNRKYAIGLMRRPPEAAPRPRRRQRKSTYGPEVVRILIAIWEAAGYPWSARLKAALPLWLPFVRKRTTVSKEVERQLAAISPRTIDRKLAAHKKRVGRRLYGRTKPGTLLKHQIPIQTKAWDVDRPGYGEIDLVSHSGSSAAGEFIHSLNFTDIASTWVETRAVMGKGQRGVHQALEEILEALPFVVAGLDSDNGSEFINDHLVRFCRARRIQMTRSRPYKKDDNAHIEQKNWTHVRRLLGWNRYDTDEVLAAINDLYRNELGLMQNLFQPSVKLLSKTRNGSRLTRRYDAPRPPLDRLSELAGADPQQVQRLVRLRRRLDPFSLSAAIDAKLERIHQLATRPGRDQTRRQPVGPPPPRVSPKPRAAFTIPARSDSQVARRCRPRSVS
jgi:hypothetical protein